MTQRYCYAAGLTLVALFSLGTLVRGQDKLQWTAFDKKGTTFFQELTTTTNQNLTVQNMQNTQDQKQTFWFKWTSEGEKDGKYVVTQEIVGLKMDINIGGNKISFDSFDMNQPQNPMTNFFKSLLGAKFTLTIDKKTMKVTNVDGVDTLVKNLSQVNQSMRPLLEKILTKESVQQMADPVLGVVPPGGEIPKDKKWGGQEQVLDMGPIGKYKTTNWYELKKGDAKDKLVEIAVKTKLVYEPPADAKGGGLPFTIKSASLKSGDDSGGTITFNREKGRIESSDLKVTLNGQLTVEIAGTPTTVTLAQTQTVSLKTYDEDSDKLPASLRKKKG